MGIRDRSTMPMFVRDYTDDEATIIMVDTNIQREDILPSEKARAYSMKYEAMKHQGKKGTGNSLDEVGAVSYTHLIHFHIQNFLCSRNRGLMLQLRSLFSQVLFPCDYLQYS